MSKSDDAFFALCEYFLADPQASAQRHRGFTEKIVHFLVRHLGWGGLLISYVALVIRDSRLALSCFKHVAVLDIHANLILGRDDIRPESRYLALRRRHLPSRRVLREMASAHRRYLILKREAQAEALESCAADTATRAVSNDMYLVWLLHFYVHRSIILANAATIRPQIHSVLTLEEFTPLIAGYLSAFSDLGIPTVLYLPGQLAQPKLTLQALPLFTKVIVRNGGAADYLYANGREDVLLEESRTSSQSAPNRSSGFAAAVFLASFYTLDETELVEFLSSSAIPYLRTFQDIWRPSRLRVFCHPNDARACNTLSQAGFDVDRAQARRVDRLKAVDIVLSGNTSVVDEAISAEVPVIYCGKLDSYKHDLMGYVKGGLVFDGTHECPTPAIIEDFFKNEETRANLQRHRRGSGEHRLVRLVDEIQADMCAVSADKATRRAPPTNQHSPICR